MVAAMVEGSTTEIHKWEQSVAQVGGSTEIDVEPDVHKLSGRVLSLTVFGGEYEIGVKVYKLQTQLATKFHSLFKELGFWLIPFYRYTQRTINLQQISYKLYVPKVKNLWYDFAKEFMFIYFLFFKR